MKNGLKLITYLDHDRPGVTHTPANQANATNKQYPLFLHYPYHRFIVTRGYRGTQYLFR